MMEIGMPDELTVADAATALNPERLRAGSDQPLQINWLFVAGVFNFHVLALLALFPWFFSWTGVILVPLGMYIFGTIGIDVGLHRLLTHRGFSSPRWLQRVFVLLGTCCVMESPAYWVAVHRRHHQFADEEQDPHSPRRSFLWSHFGWYMVRLDPMHRAKLLEHYAKDVMRVPLYAFLERDFNWVKLIVMSWLAFFGIGATAALALGENSPAAIQFGASVLIWGAFLRTAIVFQITMCVNSITHRWGYRNYATDDNSTNNFWIGVLANGEGWHNNHHADPCSARHGHFWWEFDVAWLTIRLFQQIGLAWDVKTPSPCVAAVGRK
jgi:fatty-acid desaturase